jgi:uncharacterized protein (TIRG00374 family)
MNHATKSAIKATIAVLLLVSVAYILFRNDAIGRLKDIHWPYAIAASVLILIVPAIKHIRFKMIRRAMRMQMDRRSLAVHYAVPIIGMLTPARLGEGTKIVMLSGDRKKLGFAFIVEKLYDAGTLLLIGAAAMAYMSYFTYAYLALIALIIISVAALFHLDRLVNLVFRRAILKDRWFMQNLKRLGLGSHALIGIASLAGWLINGAIAYLLILSLGAQTEPVFFVLLFLLSVLIGLATGLPGGLGAREVSSVILFQTYLNIDAGTASAFAAINLIAHYALLSIAGGAAYLLYRRIR